MTSGRVIRKLLLYAATVASPLALVAPQPAFADPDPTPTPSPTPTPPPAGPVVALGGPVEPLVGNIRTFEGDVAPTVGNIRTFTGDVTPYVGNIRTFNGDISPYVGNIRTFWGSMTPAAGELDPMVGNIRTFSDAFDAASRTALTSWTGIAAGSDSGAYSAVAGQINAMIGEGETVWGATIQAKVGQDFKTAVADPLLAKYGIDLGDPASLGKLDAFARQMFFIDWYDRSMTWSGMDRVDHWMRAINWAPSITETIGEGRDSVIGLLDFTVTGEGTQNITRYDGISSFTNGHGAAVASLMIAAHDGQGVMGIAPMASVVAYNPFDASGTAGWSDIRNGVLMLAQNGASIVNMSLGVPGSTLDQGWNQVFSDPAVAAATRSTVFVAAAGNDGSSQSQNIQWSFATNPALIIVGSVDPTGTISSFSNRPGTACLLSNGACSSGNYLMDRYIVAPGELILVSDGQGGVTRMSGTSFAAPLVSGTIALLHDRWPWLANYPKETVDIILRSARDLGAPGTDPVYGRGMLDVTAALSPLSFHGLRWYQYKDGRIVPEQMNKIRNPNEVAKWEAKGMFFYAYEDVGATFRDFAIPASSKLVDQSALSAGGSMEQLQAYIYSRFLAWVSNGGSTSVATGGPSGFTGFAQVSAAVPNSYGFNMTMSIAPRSRLVGYHNGNVPYQTAVRIAGPDDRLSLTIGEGDGAVMLGSMRGFGMASDYDPFVGGANPLLGFASGGAYLESNVKLSDRWSLSAGLTERVLRRDLDELSYLDQVAFGAIDRYHAGAQHLTLTYDAGAARVSGTYTRLREDNALLGVQSIDPQDFADGTTTDGFSLDGEAVLTPSLLLSATATVSRTRPGGAGVQNLAIASEGLISSSFQLGMTRSGVFDRNDKARITFSQPMHLEHGSIDMTTVQVIDRRTGELGPVTQRFALGRPERQLVGELMYGRTMLDGAAQLTVFGRANVKGQETDLLPAVMAGAGFRLAF